MKYAGRKLLRAAFAFAAGCAPDSPQCVHADGGVLLGAAVLPDLTAESPRRFQTLHLADLLLSTDGNIVVAVDVRKGRLEVFRVSGTPDKVLEAERSLMP